MFELLMLVVSLGHGWFSSFNEEPVENCLSTWYKRPQLLKVNNSIRPAKAQACKVVFLILTPRFVTPPVYN